MGTAELRAAALSRLRRLTRRQLAAVVAALAAVIWLSSMLMGALRPLEWSGTVEARTISVGSRSGGRVVEVLVHEGDRVAEGQVLLRLRADDLVARRAEAQGQLDQAEAALARTLHGARPEELRQAQARAATAKAALVETSAGPRAEQVASARSRLAAAQAQLDKANADLARSRTLRAQGVIAPADLDGAIAAARVAEANRDAQKEALDELLHGSRAEELRQAESKAQEAEANAQLVKAGSRAEDVQAARGQVQAARGRLAQLDAEVDELTVRAPRAAVVEALDLRPGDLLAPSATAATLLEEGQLYVRVYVPETQLGRVHLGQSVRVRVDSFPRRRFAAVVEHINIVGEYSPRNLQTEDERADQVFGVRVGLREGQELLRAGMAAFVEADR